MFANNETRLEADDDLELTAIHRAMGFEIPQAGLKLLSLSHHITYYASNSRTSRPAKKRTFRTDRPELKTQGVGTTRRA